MSLEIKRERHGFVTVALDEHEVMVVRSACEQLGELFESRESADIVGGVAPVEVIPGVLDPFSDSGPKIRPEDPALARLLPDAYPDDADATGEFRRYSEADVLAFKRGNLQTMLGTLGDGAEPIRLDQAQVQSWMYAINDLRLTIGTRLDLEEGYGELMAALPPEDPRLPLFYLYEWLSALQDGLVRVAK
ncbi:DUF2017 domain-containing protein [Sporichthya sp.]|uniref:DUF2017 domain-containing protein n=1 Tax=Sporichthya sp. TaxID=65475 RepID=UPI00181A4DA9|nr:DUF2017 domain-containing protein [Sporichthya sp.]MBA3745106.1 DUF2017 domain-containing protein [Sporichthya sp.]